MKFDLPKLAYKNDALEPHISAETIDHHYGKHHQAYVNNLNGLIEGTEYEDMDLEDIILDSEGGLFNNAAQVWNHTFYFGQLSPTPQTAPEGSLALAIDNAFGSLDEFKEAFAKAAATQFGSGWAWLVIQKDGKLAIKQTANADTPLTDGDTPLLVWDVWEHAYYIDYRNRRPEYIGVAWNVIDWAVIEKRWCIAC